MAEDRISRLSERFRTHAVGRPKTNRNRSRHSFYLDGDLVDSLDQIYRELNHDLYPHSVSKSTFIETLLEYGIGHLSEVREALPQEDAEP